MRRCVRPSIVSCSGAKGVCLGLASSFDFRDGGKSNQSCVMPSALAACPYRRPCRRSSEAARLFARPAPPRSRHGHPFKGPLDQPDFVLGRRVQVIVSPEGEVKPRGRPWPSATTIHFVPPAFARAGSCRVWLDRHRTPFFSRGKITVGEGFGPVELAFSLSWPTAPAMLSARYPALPKPAADASRYSKGEDVARLIRRCSSDSSRL